MTQAQRAVPAHTAAGIARVFNGTAKLGDGSVTVVIDPAAPGPGVIHAYVLDKYGRADDRPTAVEFQFTLPAKSLGPIDHQGVKAGPGHYQLNGTLFTLTGTNAQTLAPVFFNRTTHSTAAKSPYSMPTRRT